MSKALDVLLELKDCSDYWSEYFVPLGIHERIDDATKELLAQPDQDIRQGQIESGLDLRREPLSDKEIAKGFLLTDVWHRFECFIAGVRFAEKAHGITDNINDYIARVGLDE